jgi:alpha-galactosidase
MGWNSWCTDSLCNAAGKDPCSDEMVRSIADAIVEEGMDKLGYRYVSLDDCWSAKTRNASGHLQADPASFPQGMAAVADYVHSKGLKFGLYTCVGTKTCKGGRPGSYGHFDRDASTLAAWGVDLVKMDHCTSPKNETDEKLYGDMGAALNATGRPILFSLCSWGGQTVWEWGAKTAQMYRIAQDHFPLWTLPHQNPNQGGYGSGVRDIIEWMAHLQPSLWTKQYVGRERVCVLCVCVECCVAARCSSAVRRMWCTRKAVTVLFGL